MSNINGAQTVRVLVADENAPSRLFLTDNLAADGYQTVGAESAEDAFALCGGPLGALVVDVNGETLGIIDRVRGERGVGVDPALPIIALTSNADRLHWTRLLERGADDVIGKPFSYPELLARLNRVLERCRPPQPRSVLQAGALRVDVQGGRVWVGEREIRVGRKELGLLICLAGNPGRVFTRDELLRDVWGYQSAGCSRTVDVHASRLRQKLSVDGARFVMNVWGVGYRLTDLPTGP